jgi:hypothetical protein
VSWIYLLRRATKSPQHPTCFHARRLRLVVGMQMGLLERPILSDFQQSVESFRLPSIYILDTVVVAIQWMIAGNSSIIKTLSCISISFCGNSHTNSIESNVEETLRDSRGSFRKTGVSPFCWEKTRMMKADSLISDKVICNGIVNPDAAASGCSKVDDGFENRYSTYLMGLPGLFTC